MTTPLPPDTNLCDLVTDIRGVEHAFSHKVEGWYPNGEACYGCWCKGEGKLDWFLEHYAQALSEPFAIDLTTGYPVVYDRKEG